jgi:hypothetical protein
MVFSWILYAGVFLLAIGVALVIDALVSTLYELLVKIWTRVFSSVVKQRLIRLGVINQNTEDGKRKINWPRLISVLAVWGLAIAVHDLMLTPLVILVGLGVLWWVRFIAEQRRQAQINDDAEIVALQIRADMGVDHSLLSALQKVKLREGILKDALDQVAARLQMQQAPEEAASVLKDLPGAVTARLAALIINSARLTDAVQDALFLSLEQEVYRQRATTAKTRQTLTLVRGTIRLLQVVVAGAISFTMLFPTWRDFFISDPAHRLLFFIMVAMSVLASFYFEYEVYQLSYEEL